VSSRPPVDLARILLILVILSLLIFGSLYIVRPFLPALIWATMIVVATWPVMIAVQNRMGRRRWVAVSVMLTGLLFVIVVPLYAAVSTIAEHGGDIVHEAEALPNYALPPPPGWMHDVPIVGGRVENEWQELSDAGPGGILAHIKPYAMLVVQWLLAHARTVGALAIHLVLTITIAGILYAHGETAHTMAQRFAIRVAGDRGAAAVHLSAMSIRAVALGIVATAAAQAILGGLGLFVTGVPGAGVLTAVILVFCLAQIGSAIPLAGAVVWLFYHDRQLAGVELAVWTVLIIIFDKVLRPVLIKRGVDLPILLILTGVIGGLFAFGIVGLFIGPVVLAVTYTLPQAWVNETMPPSIEQDGKP
jgi:predicted PurR-regulated permease PerM